MEENYEVWTAGLPVVNRRQQIKFNEIDYVIVGGGITGVTTAYLLTKDGYKVALLEKYDIGAWGTCASTGFLTQMLDYQPNKYIRRLDLLSAKLLYKSHFDAIVDIEKIISEEGINCDFEKCPSFIYANSWFEEVRLCTLVNSYKKLELDAGLRCGRVLMENGYKHIDLNGGAKFNPIKYIRALVDKIEERGGIVFEHAEVSAVNDFGDHVVVETTTGQAISAKKVMMATSYLSKLPKGHNHHTSRYRTFVVQYELEGDYISGLFEDINEPYNYLRIDNYYGKNSIIIGGYDVLDAASSNRESFFNNVRKMAKNIFGDDLGDEIRYWSGEIDLSLDLIPHIGFDDRGNVFYAYGFGGNGLTYSMTAAKIFVDEISGRKNSFADLFDFKNRK